jgi:hypothetical protein
LSAFLAAAWIGAGSSPAAETASHGEPVVRAARARAPVAIDGRLDDDAWADAAVSGAFRQRDPTEGAPATEPTELRILYDDRALYVGARLTEGEPRRIARQLSRRDDIVEADSFSLYLDPHHDHRTGAMFQVSAAGVQRDAVLYDDNFENPAWDAVWESAVAIDGDGWAVEMRIPFSQLRYPAAAVQLWGVNARRVVHRKAETSWLALVPRNENGLASRMAHLEGIAGIARTRHLELLPYAQARQEYVAPARAGDPFNDGARPFGSLGLDVKYGLSSQIALVGAINPDFGQVEVDPAVVNLSANETFFEEKRPFFLEGGDIFSHFARSGASDYWSFFYFEPQLFYTRRIGRAPQARLNGAYVDAPSATTILGALKLTGRTRGGWNVGVVEALTGRETARASDGFSRHSALVEPLTHYFVGRAQRDLGRRGALGLLGTAVNRSLPQAGGLRDLLPSQAYVAGVDGHVFFDARRDWVLTGGIAASSVSGTPAAVLRVQTNALRYYQRPDAPHVTLDPAATSLFGWNYRLGVNRNSGNLLANAGVWSISPGFEPNDLGFATQADRGGGHGLVLWRNLQPGRRLRSRQFWISKWWTWNYGGDSQGDGVQAQLNVQLLNYWRIVILAQRSWATWDDRLTRGGPTMIRPGIESVQVAVTPDPRRRFGGSVSFAGQRRDFGNWSQTLAAQLVWRTWPPLTLQASPSLLRLRNQAQYLTTVPDPAATATFGARYVFGGLEQTEFALPLRVNLALSPKLTLQLYTQALLSTGAYDAIKQLETPRTYDFVPYTGALADPDFNVKALRANAVLRWEFRPGSTAYLVWTQRRHDQRYPGDFSLGRDTRALFGAASDDVFLIKVAWWLGR